MPQAPKTIRSRTYQKPPERRPSSHERYGRMHRKRRVPFILAEIAAGRTRCAICGKPLPADSSKIHVDHRIPPSSAGPVGSDGYIRLRDDESNLQLACASCNSRKQDRLQ